MIRAGHSWILSIVMKRIGVKSAGLSILAIHLDFALFYSVIFRPKLEERDFPGLAKGQRRNRSTCARLLHCQKEKPDCQLYSLYRCASKSKTANVDV
jgi:hypothetical protein